MKDYNLPPTEEFQMLTNSNRIKYIPHYWLTMMKSVMNDYWFDVSNNQYEWDYEILDELFLS